VRTSRLTAREDNNAIADGFQIYLHSFVVTADGQWAVVQQGLNDRTGMARRYHWHSAAVKDFVSQPHTGIVGEHQGTIMNLVDADAKAAQTAMLKTAGENPERTLGELRYLKMPAHHDVRAKDVDLKRLGAVLAIAYDRGLHDFAELLLLEKLGPRTLQSLALVAEVIHGAPTRFNDPARFSFAHGGKDGHPFPVPLKTYDESLNFLRSALDRARSVRTRSGSDGPNLSEQAFGKEKLDALRRLERFTRSVETRLAPQADFNAIVRHERAISQSLDGRTVMDDRRERNFFIGKGQQKLF
jgi:hypothetical protein